MHRRIILIIGLMLGLASLLRAQSDDEVIDTQNMSQDTLITRLSLDKAIEIALQNNWDIKLAQKGTSSAYQDKNIAVGNLFPSIGFTGTYDRFAIRKPKFNAPNTKDNPTPIGFSSPMGNINNIDAHMNFSQVLFNYSAFVGLKSAKIGVEVAKLAEEVQEQETILAVKMAYYDILLAKDLLQVSEESYSYSQANLENVQKFYNQGVSSEYDLLQAEVQLANSEPQVIQAKNTLALAYLSLKKILAMDLNRRIEIESGFSRYMTLKPYLDSLPNFQVENNYDYKSLESQKELAVAGINMMRSAFWPVLSLTGEWEVTAGNNHLRLKDYYYAPSVQAGLSLTFNIFSGLTNRAKVKQAKIALEEVQIQLDQLEYNLKQEAVQYQLNMDEAYKRIQAQQKGLETARKALNIAFSRYLNGVGTQLEIINNQSLFTEARSNFSQAIYDFLVALANYQALLNIR